MKIGYARVSTQDQKLDLQLKALESAGCQEIFREKASGATRTRPEFQRMFDQIRSDDTIVVWKLDRFARSTRDLLNTMEALGDTGAKFQSLSGTMGEYYDPRRQNDYDRLRRDCGIRTRFDSRANGSWSRGS